MLFFDQDSFTTENVFFLIAYVGTLFFFLRFLLNFLGFAHEEGTAFDDANLSFKFFSLHALSGFLMMFGWTGITCLRQFHLSIAWSIIIALAVGFILLWVLRLILSLARLLVSPGGQLNYQEAVGQVAVVYQRIVPGQVGKIHLSLNEFLWELEAVTEGKESIPSFTRVQVLKVLNRQCVVKPI